MTQYDDHGPPNFDEWRGKTMNRLVLFLVSIALLSAMMCSHASVSLTDGPFIVYRSGRAQPTTTNPTLYATYTECRNEIAIKAAAEPKTSGILTWGCRQNVVAKYSPCEPRADVSRETNCPAGTVGTWTQTHSWITAPAPTCWTATAYVPTAPLPPACPPIVVADTTPPTPATTITATGTSTTLITLTWGPAADNVGVTGSTVEACTGVSCASFTELWRGGGLRQYLHIVTAGSIWSYRVRALDAAGNISVPSPIATATTPPITPPPPTSEWAHCANQGQLCAFTGTRRVRYGVGTTWTERELAAVNGGAICDNVVFGNPASGVTKTCQLADTVTPPPPPPAGTGTASLNWTAPTRNTDGSTLFDLAGYRINYGTSPNVLSATIQIPATASHIVTGLAAGTWYFGVRAYTTQGQESESSNIAAKIVP